MPVDPTAWATRARRDASSLCRSSSLNTGAGRATRMIEFATGWSAKLNAGNALVESNPISRQLAHHVELILFICFRIALLVD